MGVVLDLLLPRRCVACRAPGTQLCDACLTGLPRIRPPLCARCGAPTAWPVARCRECAGRRLAFASARAAVEYDEGARRLVTAWKDSGLRDLVEAAGAVVAGELAPPLVDALVFVPADPDRRRWRGHHPPEALARELAHRWRIPVCDLLVRARAVRPQRGLPYLERRRNVRGAFRARRAPPARVALVDDVYTSGATAAAASRALRRAGAREIVVITLARATRESP